MIFLGYLKLTHLEQTKQAEKLSVEKQRALIFFCIISALFSIISNSSHVLSTKNLFFSLFLPLPSTSIVCAFTILSFHDLMTCKEFTHESENEMLLLCFSPQPSMFRNLV